MKLITMLNTNKYLQLLLGVIVLLQFNNTHSQIRYSAGVLSNYTFLDIENESIENNVRLGGGVELGLSYSISNHFSLHSGLGLNYYSLNKKTENYSSSEDAIDISGDAFEFRYRVSNYNENQELLGLNIPITIQYETQGNTRFYGRTGVEAVIFLSESYESSASSLRTSGFFPAINAELTQPLFAGFGSFTNPNFAASDVELKNSFNAILELGVKEKLKNNNALSLGLFAKLGINDLKSNQASTGLISFNQAQATEFTTTSVLEATDIQTGSSRPFTETTRLVLFGFVLRYEFSL